MRLRMETQMSFQNPPAVAAATEPPHSIASGLLTVPVDAAGRDGNRFSDELHTRLAAYLRAEGSLLEAREQSRLFDACLDAGMPFDTDDLVEWAVFATTADLVSA